MANENMIKFLRGSVANLPQTANAGTLYFTVDEGVYLGLADGTFHRYGDFIIVANVEALPTTGAHETCMYYCAAENILARYDAEKGWVQINKQPTAEEMKTLLGLGTAAYESKDAFDAAGAAQAVADYVGTFTATEDVDTLVKYIDAKTANIASDERVSGIENRVKAIEDDYLKAEDIANFETKENVKKVADDLAAYVESNDAALAGVKATADAAAVKTEVESALAGKVAKTDYEADKATFATKTELGDVDAKFANYRTSADQDTIDNGHKERIEALEAKFTGDDSVDAKIAAAVAVETQARETAVAGVQGEVDAVEGRMDTAEGKITALEGAAATHALKTEVEAVDAKFANYKTAEAQKAIDDEQDRRLGVIEGDYLKAADIANFETKENVKKVADDLAAYVESNDAALAGVKATAEAAAVKTEVEAALALKADKSVVDAMYTNAQIDGFIAAEKQRAEGIEGGLRTDVDAIKGDYLKAADKTELEGKITAEETRAKGVEESLQTQINTIMNNPDTEGVINSINEFTQYIADHGEIAEGFRTDIDKNMEDIAANAGAIADEITRATGAEEALSGRVDELKASYDEHTHSWDDLTNKPFEDALETITWDGDTTGREELSGSYKISDAYIQPDKFIGATIHFANGYTHTVVEEDISTLDDQFGTGFDIRGMVQGNETFPGSPELVGIFVAETVRSIEFSVKTLDDKFISANIARVADVNAANEALDGRIDELKASYDEHTHSWNDLTDKPFYDTATHEPITFELTDDVIENGVWTSDRRYVKVSDEVFSIEELRGSDIEYFSSYGGGKIESVQPFTTVYGTISADAMVIVIPSTDIAIAAGYGEVPAGTYFVVESDRYTNVLTFKSEIKTLDDKFISANIARTADVEEVSGRVATLEAIDHEAYVAADATLKSELQGEIEAAKAEAIADAEGKVNALAGNVYTKEEVYTKTEVEALLTWGEF